MLAFFDAAVGAGNLTSVHPPPGNQKLDAFRVLLANENWTAALSLCDGESAPVDFVEGRAREELHLKIQTMLSNVDEQTYSRFKQVGQMV